ncbi:MAG: EamA family transporter [Caldilineaceae bacterium]|nr:EamA family transporter [Caldilineaceae bacterium]
MSEQLSQAWWLILISISSGVAGQYCLKAGLNRAGSSGDGGIIELVLMIVGSPLILLGLLFYGVGALAWISVLKRMDLSYAYPFLALNFVLITLVSWLGLGETVPLLRWAGIAAICAGIVLIAQSGPLQ